MSLDDDIKECWDEDSDKEVQPLQNSNPGLFFNDDRNSDFEKSQMYIENFTVKTLDDVLLVTEEDFNKYYDLLVEKLSNNTNTDEMSVFTEQLVLTFADSFKTAAVVRKLSIALSSLSSRLKAIHEKEATPLRTSSKSKKSKIKKPQVYVDSAIVYESEYDVQYDDY
ncbi:hypothetical protein GJ496_000334 [Pomphorhynchus laevis]|nr:hypothetical protein GJ496_000334 [Pomphorhynchus laevis]